MREFFTDLADDMESGRLYEGSRVENRMGVNVRITHVNIDDAPHRRGDYYAIDGVHDHDSHLIECVLSDILEGYIANAQHILVVGFGNGEYTCDSLGEKTLGYIDIERCESTHIMTIAPLVESITGMNSIDIVRSLADTFNADVIVAVDTLATSNISRLADTLQITNAGMSPGAGVGNRGKVIDASTMSRPVIAVGVPLVIHSTAIGGNGESEHYLIPSTIDSIVEGYARTIAGGIMQAVCMIETHDS